MMERLADQAGRFSLRVWLAAKGKLIARNWVLENTKAARRRPCFFLLGLQKPVGAGEAIRTPDPNLGKVMLYP